MDERSESVSGKSDGARENLAAARHEAQQAAANAAETARRRGRDTLERAKASAADRAEDIAEALEATADNLEPDAAVAGYGHSLAGMIRDLAGGIREREIEDVVGQLAGFARRNPGAFLAGSVVLGFGIARFVKATSERQRRDDEDYFLDVGDERGRQDRSDVDSALQGADGAIAGGWDIGTATADRAPTEATPGSPARQDDGRWDRDPKDPGAPEARSSTADPVEPGLAARSSGSAAPSTEPGSLGQPQGGDSRE
jgi:hypothetical protein